MNIRPLRLPLPVLLLALVPCSACNAQGQPQPNADGWIQLFNGKDLTGWTPKIKGYDLGNNYANTFRVEDGVLKVAYEPDKYEKFSGRFGHLFYKQPYSHYILRAEYRFTGEQATGGPGWAVRNSGLMLHCQDPKTMRKDQNFPVSIEVQLLGGNGTDERTTGNVCSPGTHVVMKDKLVTQHCNSSQSKTYHKDEWVTIEVHVHGDERIRHVIDGETVMQYTKPQLDDTDEDAKKLIKDGNKALTGGYISLQSESHPIEFRRVELKPLTGGME